jgi:hypothetical protein
MIDDRTARELRSTLRLAYDIVRRLDSPKPEEIITDIEKHLGPDAVLTPTTHDLAPPCSAGLSPAAAQASSPAPAQPTLTGVPLKPDVGLSGDVNPFLRKPPQPDHTDFTQLVDSPSAKLPLSPEQERKLRGLVTK